MKFAYSPKISSCNSPTEKYSAHDFIVTLHPKGPTNPGCQQHILFSILLYSELYTAVHSRNIFRWCSQKVNVMALLHFLFFFPLVLSFSIHFHFSRFSRDELCYENRESRYRRSGFKFKCIFNTLIQLISGKTDPNATQQCFMEAQNIRISFGMCPKVPIYPLSPIIDVIPDFPHLHPVSVLLCLLVVFWIVASIPILFGFPLASHAEDTTKENTSFRETSNKRIDIDVDKGFANYGTFRLGALVGIRMHWASFLPSRTQWSGTFLIQS